MNKEKQKQKAESNLSVATLPSRGRVFEGIVMRKFPRRITIEFERVLYNYKYERYFKKKTRIHARLPDSMENEVSIGDYVKVRECRPLSKLIHHVVIAKIKGERREEKK